MDQGLVHSTQGFLEDPEQAIVLVIVNADAILTTSWSEPLRLDRSGRED